MLGLGATVRRLVHPLAWPLAIVFLLGTVGDDADVHARADRPSRLAAGDAEPDGRRACAIRARRAAARSSGVASAVSLTIGLEMLPYAAMAGAIIALRWVWDRGEARGSASMR